MKKLKSGKLIPLFFWFIILLNTFKVTGTFIALTASFHQKSEPEVKGQDHIFQFPKQDQKTIRYNEVLEKIHEESLCNVCSSAAVDFSVL